MTGGVIQTALAVMLGLLLVRAVVTDIRRRDISNRLTGTVALLAPVCWWTAGLDPWPGMAIQLGLGLAVFALFAIAFMLGGMGGGDVKLLGALALWLPLPDPLLALLGLPGATPLPFHDLLMTIAVMSIIGGGLTLVMVIAHRLRKLPGKPETPYGVAISAAGLWAIGEPYLNHFV